MRKIKAGDTVVVITGDEKGKKGKVLSVSGNRVVVEGVNKMKKFVKKNALGQNQDGTVVEIERPFQISNVQVIDPKSGKGTRVRFEIRDGKKIRVAKRSNEVVTQVALEEAKEEAEVVSEKPEKKVTKKKVVKSRAKKNETA
ncbi:50S ribosomal protein L24 [bacterium]|nr:50S ribosomal protein L24 [bacterium]